MGKMTSWHVGVAAEAFVAAQFARMRYDVSVQYGANQPEYDLIAVSGDKMLKISVKGSQDGGWGLTQSYKKGWTVTTKRRSSAWYSFREPRMQNCRACIWLRPPRLLRC